LAMSFVLVGRPIFFVERDLNGTATESSPRTLPQKGQSPLGSS
jgi:hypothetical protein